MRRAAIFTRVSTDKQTTENQLQLLREVAERAGWHRIEVYEEVVSGAAARGRRAAYDRMLKDGRGAGSRSFLPGMSRGLGDHFGRFGLLRGALIAAALMLATPALVHGQTERLPKVG